MKRLLELLSGNGVKATLRRGAVGSFIVQCSGAIILLGFYLVLARLMGPAAYGDYMVVLSWVQLLGVVAAFGIDTSLVRYIPQYVARQDWGAFRGLLWWATKATFLLGCLVSVSMALVPWFVGDRFRPELVHTWWAGAVMLPVLLFGKLNQAVLRGLGVVVTSHSLEQNLRPALLFCAVGGYVLLLGATPTSHCVMLLNAACALVALAIGLLCLRKHVPAMGGEGIETRSREWLGLSTQLLLMSGSYLILNRTDALMLGAIVGTKDAGIYLTASRLATLILFGLSAGNSIAAPMVSRLYTEGRHAELQAMVLHAFWGIAAVSIPVAAALAAFGTPLLGLFGDRFQSGHTALTILAVGHLVNALSGSVGFLLTMTGHQKDALLVLLAAAILNAILIPSFGMTGAALGTACTTALWNITLGVVVLRRLNIHTTPFTRFLGRR